MTDRSTSASTPPRSYRAFHLFPSFSADPEAHVSPMFTVRSVTHVPGLNPRIRLTELSELPSVQPALDFPMSLAAHHTGAVALSRHEMTLISFEEALRSLVATGRHGNSRAMFGA